MTIKITLIEFNLKNLPTNVSNGKVILSQFQKNINRQNTVGDAGDRTLYLSHAKRALYHLSYIPIRKFSKINLNSPQ